MKRKIFASLCLATLAGFLFYSHARAQTSASVKSSSAMVAQASGRYQLVTTTIDHVVPEPERVVLRIDSQTGQAWMLSLHGTPAGSEALFWNPIEDNAAKPN